jgi:hypothetical protein
MFNGSDGNGFTMPVAPIGYGGGYGNGGFGLGGDGIWGGLLLGLLFGGLGGWGGFGGFGGGWGNMFGMDMMGLAPYFFNTQTQNDVNRGFDNVGLSNQINSLQSSIDEVRTDSRLNGIQSAITTGFGDTALGIAGINQNICQTGNNVVSAITGAQGAISNQLYGNEIANLNRSFAEQAANAQGFNNLNTGVADLKYTVATENCADRTAAAQNTRDIIDSQTRGTQAILDKLCQLELDGVKAQVDAKNDKILDLQNQLNLATMRESQTAQNTFIQQGFSNEVDALYNRLSNCPVPTTPVYGRTPIFTCNGNNGCGCNGNFYN